MTIEINEEIAIRDHAEHIDQIKKKFPSGETEYSYEYCMLLDGSEPDMSSQDSYIKSVYSKYGVSLQAKQGRKKIDLLISRAKEEIDNIPPTFVKRLADGYNKRIKDTEFKALRCKNLDTILKAVGKKGSSSIEPAKISGGNGLEFMNKLFRSFNDPKPTYPTKEDFMKVHPEIYKSKLSEATKDTIVFFKPHLEELDEWGFIKHKVIGAYRPTLKDDKRVRVIFFDDIHSCILIDEEFNKTEDVVEYWISLQGNIITKFEACEEGKIFKGWKGAKEYKLTSDELSNLISGRIFDPEMRF